jgi:hypothetical protein
VLQLADRVSVLRVPGRGEGSWARAVERAVAPGAGPQFNPEHVEALAAALARPDFPSAAAEPGDADLRDDPAFGGAVLAEADLRGLAHLFWQLVDFRSRFTATHTAGVAAVAAYLAPLAGIAGAAARRVSIAAGLHDLGKLAVPSEMLEKEQALTVDEAATLRRHPLNGWRILQHVAGLEDVNRWANFHHERLDGQGYPFRLAAAELPLESRIVAVADIFTALTEERPYRRGMSGREATRILADMADGGAIDGDLVALVARNRAEAAVVRRLAQEGAAGRYLSFRESAAPGAHRESAA